MHRFLRNYSDFVLFAYIIFLKIPVAYPTSTKPCINVFQTLFCEINVWSTYLDGFVLVGLSRQLYSLMELVCFRLESVFEYTTVCWGFYMRVCWRSYITRWSPSKGCSKFWKGNLYALLQQQKGCVSSCFLFLKQSMTFARYEMFKSRITNELACARASECNHV